MNINTALLRRNFCTSPNSQKTIQVCILGAHTNLGRATSFIMKQNPIISTLKLQGDYLVSNLVADLEGMDTSCKVESYEGSNSLPKALRSVDIVLMLGSAELKEKTPMVDRVMAEGRRVLDLTKELILYAPRSLIIVNVPPVSVMTPLVAAIFRESNWYHPGRIIGSAALAQIKANTAYARGQDLDPQTCQVPIVGGPDVDLAVPLYSRAQPVELNDRISKCLLAKFRNVDPAKFPKVSGDEDFLEKCTNCEAYALNHMVSCIGPGLCGGKDSCYNAFVRSNVVTTCSHLVTTLQFSRGGVSHNFGLPELTELELETLEAATLAVKRRERIALEYLEYVNGGGKVLPPFKTQEVERRKMLQQTVFN